MALVHQNFPAGILNTKGLGLEAGDGTLITTTWHLIGFNILVSLEKGNDGGSYPLDFGQIKDLYKPVPAEQQPYLTPYDYDPFRKKTVVHIKMMMGETSFEKDYFVSAKRAKTIVSVLNFINATRDKMSATAKNLKKIAIQAIISVKNFRKRR